MFLNAQNKASVEYLEKAIDFLGKFEQGLYYLLIDCNITDINIRALHLAHNIVDMKRTEVSIETAFLAIKQFERKFSRTEHQFEGCLLKVMPTDMRRYSIRKHYLAVANITKFTATFFSTNNFTEEQKMLLFSKKVNW